MTFNPLTFAALFAVAVSALSINPTGDANVLAKAILGNSPGIKLLSASYAGSPDSSGTYTGGPMGIRDSAVLTSGNAVDTIIGPDTLNADISRQKNTAGNPLCTALAGGIYESADAAVLTMQVELETGYTGFFSEFIFASEEYPEWIDKGFNDVFGIYVDGKQIAFDETNNPITINGPFFKSGAVIVPPASGSSFDGSTPLLRSGHVTTVGTHKIEIAICDIADDLRDSSVFVTLGACTGECKSGTTIAPCAGKGGDSDGDGICDDVDICPSVYNPDQNPAACGKTTPPTHGNTTLTAGPTHINTTAGVPHATTFTSYVTKTITTCTARTICHPTVTVEPVVYTSTILMTVTTPCSTYTITKCSGGPGSPCSTYTSTVTLSPTYTHKHYNSTVHYCPGGSHCAAPTTTTSTFHYCPGGSHCPPPTTSTTSKYTVTPSPQCPGYPHCSPTTTLYTVTPSPQCPGYPNCSVAPSPTYTPVCPGAPGCPVPGTTTTYSSSSLPVYTGAAGRVGAGVLGPLILGAAALIM